MEDNNMKDKFEKFHEDNPHVYVSFCDFAHQAIRAGFTTLSSKFIFERMRWEAMVVTKGDKYVLNNNYTAFYARMFENDHIEFSDIFRNRRSVADSI
jgi:hypothetical protein